MYLLDTTALDGLASALSSAISTNTMVSNITALVGFIGGLVIFAFTYRLVKKGVTGASKGKAKM